jgi:O-methyltransferase domain/Dimerisation domain
LKSSFYYFSDFFQKKILPLIGGNIRVQLSFSAKKFISLEDFLPRKTELIAGVRIFGFPKILAQTPRSLDEVSPGQTLHSMIFGYRNTQAIYVVAKLGVPDLLKKEGPQKSDILASKLEVDLRSLHRVMRALASVGVFSQDHQDRFGLTPLSELLCSDADRTLRYFAILLGEEHYASMGDLLYTVRTGETAFNKMYGMGLFQYLSTHADANSTFNAAMHGSGTEWKELPQFYDFKRFYKIVDVGGGHGALISTILRSSVESRGILYDLPDVVRSAVDYLLLQEVLDRCEVIAGDALTSVPAGGDLYTMSYVLHAFQDDNAGKILKNCRSSIASDGRLLLMEQVLPEGAAPSPGKMFDLIMLATSGGIERTKSEWEALLRGSGFELTTIVETSFGDPLIEARPI